MDEPSAPPPALPSSGPRPASLALQVEQVSLALDSLRDTQARLEQMEARLASMTEACAGILDRWAHNDERHASAVLELHGRLSEWNDIERRLLSESATRIHQFEQGLQHEWQALRRRHEEPLERLDDQAARIKEACMAAVQDALAGFERAEGRLAAMEQQIARRMGDLSREVRDALGELRTGSAALAPVRPWPLEHVMRLHGELRAEANDERLPHDADHGATPGDAPIDVTPSPVTAGRSGRPRALPASTLSAPPPQGASPVSRVHPLAAAMVAAGLLAALAMGAFGWQARSEARAAVARADAAERELADARARERERADAATRVTEARLASVQQAARSAQVLAGVLGAPDLRRFELVARAGSGHSGGQVLWSRVEGIAFTAPRLTEPPAGWGYQLWLLAPGRVVPVGVMQPDAGGRTSGTFDPPADLPRPIVGAMVTLEPSAGSTAPTGPAVLRQLPAAPPPPAPQS